APLRRHAAARHAPYHGGGHRADGGAGSSRVATAELDQRAPLETPSRLARRRYPGTRWPTPSRRSPLPWGLVQAASTMRAEEGKRAAMLLAHMQQAAPPAGTCQGALSFPTLRL